MARKKAARKARDPFPEDALRDLGRRLEKELPPIVILRGEERYFRDRGVSMATERAKADGLELCRHDALDPEYSASRLIDDLSSVAMFDSARCIVVHGADRIVVERASKFSAAARDAMKARLEAGGDGTLVLSADKLRADHALAKLATSLGAPIVGCRRLYDTPPQWDPDPRKAELVQWCTGRAKALGVDASPNEAAYVCAATGNDLAAIDDQLRRLVGRGAEAIQELVAWDATAAPWEVADHMVSGDLRRALAGLETLFSGGAAQRDGSRTLDAGGIIAQLSSAISGKLRETMRAADGIARGLDPKRAIDAAEINGPPAAKKALEARLASRHPSAWTTMLTQLGEVERRSRSSVTVDATDFAQLALAWRARSRGR